MDLTQRKLTKEEWDGIEVPVNKKELSILEIIKKGFYDQNYYKNMGNTFLSIIKIDNSESIDTFIFITYLHKALQTIYKKYHINRNVNIKSSFKPKKKDTIRIENSETIIKNNKSAIFEFIVIDIIENIFRKKHSNNENWNHDYYTLIKLCNTIENYNSHLKKETEFIIKYLEKSSNKSYIIKNAATIIQYNSYIEQFRKIQLYQHQKELFLIFNTSSNTIIDGNNNNNGKLVFYVAPTGTGKTLSPIGLSEKHRIIFVCAARHIGLALAKSAISTNKKIALAFGCSDSEQIRLHYSAAKEYTRNYKSGGIYKVDNSVGDKVEIMISDVKSYLVAMRYMTAFRKPSEIITYWDEPTITMDYDNHPCHELIKNNWTENIIPNIVLSSATLPDFSEIQNTISSFKTKFGGNFYNVCSNDCNNTVTLLSKENYIVLPHHLHDNYKEVVKCINFCKKKSSLMRYMDIEEISKFVLYLNNGEFIVNDSYSIDEYFESISDITSQSLKEYYLNIFRFIQSVKWNTIYQYFISDKNRTQLYTSSINFMTNDAYTITDGPAIYLTNDVKKVSKYCYQQSNIPNKLMQVIEKTIEENSKINNIIDNLNKNYEDLMNKSISVDNDKPCPIPKNSRKIQNDIEQLSYKLKPINIPDTYIPNSTNHLKKYYEITNLNIFKSEISEETIIKLMKIGDIENIWKILLLIGVGAFVTHKSIGYTEIMKELAESQKLMMIIASSDYIYGTNYQFCHGYLGKDLIELTQEKLIQAMGRVGRQSSNNRYTLRFRDNKLVQKIFTNLDVKLEAQNMNMLFS